MTTTYFYTGDVSLEYGGAFIDLSTFDDGYCSAVRVTDLDSGCGFTGAVLIEHIVVNGTDDDKRISEALKCCGYYGIDKLDDDTRKRVIAESLMQYGFTDPDDCWDGYRSHHSETLQLDPDGPMQFDGWKADKRLHGTELRDYVESVHLS
jgi:hypothetical protein